MTENVKVVLADGGVLEYRNSESEVRNGCMYIRVPYHAANGPTTMVIVPLSAIKFAESTQTQ